MLRARRTPRWWLLLSLLAACAGPPPSAPSAPRAATAALGAGLSTAPRRLPLGTPSGLRPAPPDAAPPDVERAHADFRRWLDAFLAAPRARRAELAAEGAHLAAVRAPLFRSLLLQQPEQALALALSPLERAELPVAVAAHVERWRDGLGTLHVVDALPEEPLDTSEGLERLVTFDGEGQTMRAGVFGARAFEPTLERARLHGVELDGVIALTGSRLRRLLPSEDSSLLLLPRPPRAAGALYHAGDRLLAFDSEASAAAYDEALATEEQAATAASSWTQGPKTVLYVRVDFSDKAGDPVSQATAENVIDTQCSNFYDANSFGTASMSTTVTPTLRLPRTQADYKAADDYPGLMNDARTLATNAGYTLASYDRLVVAFAATFGGGWAGRGYVGGSGVWLNGYFDLRVVGHELGHNYGLNHANYWNAPGLTVIGPGTTTEYGNPFDMMGSQGAAKSHFGAWFKRELDWVVSPEVTVVSASGTYRLYALESAISSGAHGLKVPRDAAKDYWLEYRPGFATTATQGGAVVYWGYPYNTTSQLLDMTPGDGSRANAPLRIGTTFSDALAGIHLTPVGKGGTTPESLDVVVNLGTFPSNHPPSVTLSASATSVASGVAVTFSATASDPDGDPLAYDWDFDDGTFGSNAPAASKSWTTEKVYQVRCTVSDMKGQTASASVAVTVGAPATFTLAGAVTSGGQPVGGVRVSDGTRATFTTSDGLYLLTGVPAGSYTVSAAKTDFTFTRSFGTPVAVAGSMTGLDFAATPVAGYTVKGRVYAMGTGLSGVTVSDGTRVATTNSSGDFTLSSVPSGRYLLSASAPGWQFSPSGFTNPIDVLGGGVTGANFYASGQTLAGLISGPVTTAPTVTDGVRTATATQSGANWYYSLGAVPNGNWNVVATSPGVTLTPQFANPVTVAGAGQYNLDFSATATASYLVSGTARTGGTPLPGVTVSDGTRSAVTDSLGRYSLVGVPAGGYTLTPSMGGYTFVPATLAVTVSSANLSGEDFATTVVNAPPTVVTAASATPSPVTSGTTTTLSVLGDDDTGEAALTYSWTASGSSYPVAFSGNGTHAAKNVTATFSGAGSYTLECVIADPGGLSVRSATVVQVQQVPTSLAVTPSAASVLAGATQPFTAQLKDQFAHAMYVGAATWVVSGGGTVSAGGLFTAGATPSGPFTLTATEGGVAGSAQVTVTAPGAPTLVTAASASPNPVTGATTQVSVRADDDTGEPGLVYHWAATTAPAPVTFAPNDDNAAKDAVATFSAAGAYVLQVTVTDGMGNTVSSAVAVTVEATASHLELQPAVVDLQPLQTQLFTATVEDQFAAPLAPQPALTWSVSGGGAVDAAGLFTAGATPGGPYTLTASGGGLMALAQVTLSLAPDTHPPSVSLTAPAPNAVVTGALALEAAASDDVGVTKVAFYADGATLLGEATSAPYQLTVPGGTLADGAHLLTAQAFDAAGNSATSDGVPITVGSGPVDAAPPVVSIVTPAQGASTPLGVPVSLEASDDVGVTKVQLELDGAVAAEWTQAPWSGSLDVSAGAHTLVAIAWDASGKLARSEAVTFTADAQLTPPPSTPPGPVTGGCGCSGAGTHSLAAAGLMLALLLRSRRRVRGSPRRIAG